VGRDRNLGGLTMVARSDRNPGGLTMVAGSDRNRVGLRLVEGRDRNRGDLTLVAGPDRNLGDLTLVAVPDRNRVGRTVGRAPNLVDRTVGHDLRRRGLVVGPRVRRRRPSNRVRLLLIGAPSLPTEAINARNRNERPLERFNK
jgi:hypothetical protein